MAEVRIGKVNCIVVKDLSRFGRNYTELGNFIEKIFPFLGVRFVAVNDNLDTFHMDDPNKSLEVILKNIVNETYATDISKKVSSSVAWIVYHRFCSHWMLEENCTYSKNNL